MRRCPAVAVLAPILCVLLETSCSRREPGSDARRSSDSALVAVAGDEHRAPSSAPDSPATSPSPSLDTTSAITGTLAELRERLRTEAGLIVRAAAAPAFDEVAARALRTRDLAVALSGKTASLPQQRAQEIETLVANLTRETEGLRAHAVARETVAVRTRSAGLQQMVTRIGGLAAP
jgi:hypothetical protein